MFETGNVLLRLPVASSTVCAHAIGVVNSIIIIV